MAFDRRFSVDACDLDRMPSPFNVADDPAFHEDCELLVGTKRRASSFDDFGEATGIPGPSPVSKQLGGYTRRGTVLPKRARIESAVSDGTASPSMERVRSISPLRILRTTSADDGMRAIGVIAGSESADFKGLPAPTNRARDWGGEERYGDIPPIPFPSHVIEGVSGGAAGGGGGEGEGVQDDDDADQDAWGTSSLVGENDTGHGVGGDGEEVPEVELAPPLPPRGEARPSTCIDIWVKELDIFAQRFDQSRLDRKTVLLSNLLGRMFTSSVPIDALTGKRLTCPSHPPLVTLKTTGERQLIGKVPKLREDTHKGKPKFEIPSMVLALFPAFVGWRGNGIVPTVDPSDLQPFDVHLRLRNGKITLMSSSLRSEAKERLFVHNLDMLAYNPFSRTIESAQRRRQYNWHRGRVLSRRQRADRPKRELVTALDADLFAGEIMPALWQYKGFATGEDAAEYP